MAQDFGDDMGNALLNFVTRQTENYLRFGRGRERAFDWWQRHYKKEGNTPEQAKAMAEKQSSREQVVVPFGTSEEAAYYAQVCRENGTYAAAYTDKQGNGFLQLYVYAAFSPIPISLLGFEETKQIGIGYLKNFAAAALAGVVMVLILYLYPHLVTALAVSGGLGKAEMLGLAQGVETFDSFGVIIKTIAVLITTMMGLVKSGSWAKEILGA